jgi:hypothetical protein
MQNLENLQEIIKLYQLISNDVNVIKEEMKNIDTAFFTSMSLIREKMTAVEAKSSRVLVELLKTKNE